MAFEVTPGRVGSSNDALSTSITSVGASSDEFMREWDDLAGMLGAGPFARPGFLILWHRWFGDGELVAATVRRRGQLVAVLPLMRTAHQVLRYPANWHTPLASILASDRESCAALADVVVSAGARRVAIPLLDRSDDGVSAFTDCMSERRYRVIQRTQGRSPYRDLRGDWDGFQAEMSGKARRDIRRRRRRLEEAGNVTVDHITSSAQLDERLQEAFLVEGSGWKNRRGTAIREQAATVGFYTDLARWAVARGWLRLTFLRLDGKPLAVSLALWADGVHYGLKTGYDVAFANHAPGVLVVDDEVRAAFDAGLTRFEMLGEADEYKRIWCDSARERVGVQAFAPSLGGYVAWMVFARIRPLATKLGVGRLARAFYSEGPRL